jgi:hypothetical protein
MAHPKSPSRIGMILRNRFASIYKTQKKEVIERAKKKKENERERERERGTDKL